MRISFRGVCIVNDMLYNAINVFLLFIFKIINNEFCLLSNVIPRINHNMGKTRYNMRGCQLSGADTRPNSTLSATNSQRKKHSFYRQLNFPGEHEFAGVIYDASESGGIYGAKATLNLWNPSVKTGVGIREYSATQIKIKSGTANAFDVIEAGWHVYPWYHRAHRRGNEEDDKTRFFISWTNDSYQRACYNMDCGGFVMERNDVLGRALEPTSSYNGEQKEIVVEIWKDIQLGRWRLKYNDIMVGYWPEHLFTHLRTHGTEVEWGGEVFNNKHNNIFTSTQMGSGRSAEEGYGKASYFKNQRVKTSSSSGHNWISPPTVRGEVSSSDYYTIFADADIDGSGDDGFFYGGPGNTN
ncbi:uncharacterized protein LOC120009495 [Tripterygium wilfordii]|uniref:uncharacterized protein LOC120009495 n=1 Tax=Tripterygium wilfordii TaxID=458696 RepID=UPI0018F7FABF|nr:uncharacterized protein LOC120009495 [Tripterygium wilfordii]